MPCQCLLLGQNTWKNQHKTGRISLLDTASTWEAEARTLRPAWAIYLFFSFSSNKSKCLVHASIGRSTFHVLAHLVFMMTCYGVSHVQFTKRRFRCKEIKQITQNYKHSVLKTQTQKSVKCSQMKKTQRGEGWWRDESDPNVLYSCMKFSKSKLIKRKKTKHLHFLKELET